MRSRRPFGPKAQINADQARDLIHTAGLVIYGGALALGVAFVVFGIIVKLFPVPITILSLVLYILSALVFAALNPMSLLAGLLMKVIIIVALSKAIKAAFEYEREKREGYA